MPESKKRKPHTHPHIDYIPHKKKKKSVVPYTVSICTLFALGIAWFAVGDSSVIGLLAISAAGVVIGYFAGRQLDATFNKSGS